MERGSHDVQLITTKLAIPPNYLKKIIPRPHIYAQLDGTLQRPLMLLSASAGFGKTTLVSEWLRKHQQLAPAWVSLEQADNDLIRFWRYLITALDQHHPGLIQQSQDWSQALHPATIEATLTTLINSLISLQQQTVLVLDNYHAITNTTIHHTLTFLLEHLPPQLHLILIARNDPPLPLARFRVQGKLAELRSADLRFTLDETRLFLTQTMGLDIQEDEIMELAQHTEGWIAGLQLAALSLQGRDNHATISHFIHTFTGTNRHVLNYLTDEVLIYQPEEIQNFLLQTSILERLNASLCDAVTEQCNGEEMLERLEQNNLFLTALDNQQQWYRYDRLFAELLRYRLKQKMPASLPELHHRASHWYEQQNMFADAIIHALAADDIAKAATLIENNVWSFIQDDDDLTVLNWLTQLPTEAIAERPLLSFLHAMTLFFQAKLEDCEHALARAEELWQQEQNTPMLSHVYNLRATIALLQSDGVQTIAYAHQALNLAQDEQSALHNQAMVSLGAGYLIQGEIDQANQYITESYRRCQRQLDIKTMLSATIQLGILQMAQGHLRVAVQTFQQILIEPTSTMIGYRAVAHTYLADIYREWNDIATALEHSQQAMQLIEQTQHEGFAPTKHYIVAAQLAWLSDEYEQAMHLLDQAEQSAQRFGTHRTFLAQITVQRVRFLLSKRDRAAAQRWLTQYAPSTDEGLSVYEREAWAIARARLLMSQEQGSQAIVLLESVYDQAKNQKRIQSQIMLLILLTLAHHSEGNTQQTRQFLEQALTLAELGGYTRLFTDEGNIMAALLTELYNKYQRHASSELQTISLGYIYTLLNSFGTEAQPPLWMIAQENEDILIDKLSEREYMVLGLIAEGLSNQEIAQKLVVTVSTIKTHLNNIYAKLHVHTRLQAVTKAYDLGVLRRSEIDTEPLSHPRSIEKM